MSAIARGAVILAVGVIMGAALVAAAVDRIEPAEAAPVLAAAIAVLVYLARTPDPSR